MDLEDWILIDKDYDDTLYYIDARSISKEMNHIRVWVKAIPPKNSDEYFAIQNLLKDYQKEWEGIEYVRQLWFININESIIEILSISAHDKEGQKISSLSATELRQALEITIEEGSFADIIKKTALKINKQNYASRQINQSQSFHSQNKQKMDGKDSFRESHDYAYKASDNGSQTENQTFVYVGLAILCIFLISFFSNEYKAKNKQKEEKSKDKYEMYMKNLENEIRESMPPQSYTQPSSTPIYSSPLSTPNFFEEDRIMPPQSYTQPSSALTYFPPLSMPDLFEEDRMKNTVRKELERNELLYGHSVQPLTIPYAISPTLPSNIFENEPALTGYHRGNFSQPLRSPNIREFQTVSPSATPRSAINSSTGEFYPGVAGGVINPNTGHFYPDVGGGYVNEKGQFMPKLGP